MCDFDYKYVTHPFWLDIMLYQSIVLLFSLFFLFNNLISLGQSHGQQYYIISEIIKERDRGLQEMDMTRKQK